MDPIERDLLLAREITGDERLLWSGEPKQGLILRLSDVLTIPFSLLWCGFAVFWERSVLRGHAPIFFALWGVPFIVMGLYMVVGRFFADAALRRNTVYAVTSQRVIIVSGLFKPSIKSLNLRGLFDISLHERSDGTGTVILGPTGPFGVFAGPSWPASRRQSAPPALEGIRDARLVYNKIREAQKSLTIQSMMESIEPSGPSVRISKRFSWLRCMSLLSRTGFRSPGRPRCCRPG